jgi:chromosome partition protein MukE
MSEPFHDLGDAIQDQRFVDIDLALRRGAHIDRDDADGYAYLLDAQGVLEPFYRRYGCELVQRSDGYFFLLPTGDKVSKRLLGLPEMIVGQGAALLYLDPSTVESGGVVSKDDLLSHLASVMGTDVLVGVFNPKRKRMDERVAQETVRQKVSEGLRKLAQLGFVTLSEDHRVHLRSSLMRFADPVRGAGSPRDALEKLIARGEVSIPPEAILDEGGDESALESSDESARDSSPLDYTSADNMPEVADTPDETEPTGVPDFDEFFEDEELEASNEEDFASDDESKPRAPTNSKVDDLE